MSERARVVVAAVVAVLVTMLPGVAAADDLVEIAITTGSVVVSVEPGGVVQLGSGRRLLDTVRMHAVDGKVLVVSDVTLEDYVAGIAEMPARWDLEALRAQAVAARTYAWWQKEQRTYERRGLPYDICASTACQVYDGHRVVETALVGERWREAVATTAGEVLVDAAGAPILARYHSTSGGLTRDNALVYPSSGDRTYLRGVDDPFDAVSPLHEWTVRFSRARFDELLAVGKTLSAVSPMASIRTIPASDGFPSEVVVTGVDGREVRVGAVAFRRFVSDVAPSRWPGEYPSQRSVGTRRLPTTLPSSRYAITVTDDEVIIDGAGWGHGVGMSQYGAWGRAQAGQQHDEILAAYYGGLLPSVRPDTPSRMRVGVGSVDAVEITPDASMRVEADGALVTARGFGTYVVRADGDQLIVLAPGGYGAALVMTPTIAARPVVSTLGIVELTATSNKQIELRLEVVDADGTVRVDRRLGHPEGGAVTTRWDLDDDAGIPLSAGDYEVRLVALDEVDVVGGVAASLTIAAPVASGPGESLLTDRATERPDLRVPAAGAAGALLGALAGGAWGDRRRRLVSA